MKEETITTLLGDFMVYEKSKPTNIPKGKTPIRGVGITPRKMTSRNRGAPYWEKIYDKVLFIDTDQLSCSYGEIQTFVGDKMMKLKKCRNAHSWGNLLVHFNVFNIEENKWEGFDVRKGTK